MSIAATDALHFSVRGLGVTLSADPPSLLGPLSHLAVHARDDEPVVRELRFTLSIAGPDKLRVREDDAADAREVCCIEAALTGIAQRISTRALALYADKTCLHGASMSIDGRPALFVGARGSGKTTLMLRLLLDGAAFHGDEYVLTGADGMAHSLPRVLHVKPGTLERLPAVAEACRGKPRLQLRWDNDFYPLDPTDLGHDWRSVDARPAAIFFLTPAFDAPPAIEPMAQIDMVRELMQQVIGIDQTIGRQARDVCALVRGTPCFGLRVGDLDATAARVCETLRALPTASAG
ncbi:MAG: hypothetical protein PHQ14_08930 [Chromatiales bacterium]|jgi:hypothetical protein|nr:hypothetical protein [Chromatiales bacterium]MDX9767663.1 hypothetical protein [Ectothiorhodospiraceae bacterium]